MKAVRAVGSVRDGPCTDMFPLYARIEPENSQYRLDQRAVGRDVSEDMRSDAAALIADGLCQSDPERVAELEAQCAPDMCSLVYVSAISISTVALVDDFDRAYYKASRAMISEKDIKLMRIYQDRLYELVPAENFGIVVHMPSAEAEQLLRADARPNHALMAALPFSTADGEVNTQRLYSIVYLRPGKGGGWRRLPDHIQVAMVLECVFRRPHAGAPALEPAPANYVHRQRPWVPAKGDSARDRDFLAARPPLPGDYVPLVDRLVWQRSAKQRTVAAPHRAVVSGSSLFRKPLSLLLEQQSASEPAFGRQSNDAPTTAETPAQAEPPAAFGRQSNDDNPVLEGSLTQEAGPSAPDAFGKNPKEPTAADQVSAPEPQPIKRSVQLCLSVIRTGTAATREPDEMSTKEALMKAHHVDPAHADHFFAHKIHGGSGEPELFFELALTTNTGAKFLLLADDVATRVPQARHWKRAMRKGQDLGTMRHMPLRMSIKGQAYVVIPSLLGGDLFSPLDTTTKAIDTSVVRSLTKKGVLVDASATAAALADEYAALVDKCTESGSFAPLWDRIMETHARITEKNQESSDGEEDASDVAPRRSSASRVQDAAERRAEAESGPPVEIYQAAQAEEADTQARLEAERKAKEDAAEKKKAEEEAAEKKKAEEEAAKKAEEEKAAAEKAAAEKAAAEKAAAEKAAAEKAAAKKAEEEKAAAEKAAAEKAEEEKAAAEKAAAEKAEEEKAAAEKAAAEKKAAMEKAEAAVKVMKEKYEAAQAEEKAAKVKVEEEKKAANEEKGTEEPAEEKRTEADDAVPCNDGDTQPLDDDDDEGLYAIGVDDFDDLDGDRGTPLVGEERTAGDKRTSSERDADSEAPAKKKKKKSDDAPPVKIASAGTKRLASARDDAQAPKPATKKSKAPASAKRRPDADCDEASAPAKKKSKGADGEERQPVSSKEERARKKAAREEAARAKKAEREEAARIKKEEQAKKKAEREEAARIKKEEKAKKKAEREEAARAKKEAAAKKKNDTALEKDLNKSSADGAFEELADTVCAVAVLAGGGACDLEEEEEEGEEDYDDDDEIGYIQSDTPDEDDEDEEEDEVDEQDAAEEAKAEQLRAAETGEYEKALMGLSSEEQRLVKRAASTVKRIRKNAEKDARAAKAPFYSTPGIKGEKLDSVLQLHPLMRHAEGVSTTSVVGDPFVLATSAEFAGKVDSAYQNLKKLKSAKLEKTMETVFQCSMPDILSVMRVLTPFAGDLPHVSDIIESKKTIVPYREIAASAKRKGLASEKDEAVYASVSRLAALRLAAIIMGIEKAQSKKAASKSK